MVSARAFCVVRLKPDVFRAADPLLLCFDSGAPVE
jgi:hypothetical protein